MANPSDINRSCSTVPFILSTRKWDETTRVTHAFPLTRLSIRGRASLFRFLINCRSDAEGYKRIDLFVLRDDNLIRFMKGLVVTCKHIDRLDLRENLHGRYRSFYYVVLEIILSCLLQFKLVQKKMRINPIYNYYKTKAKENVPVYLRLYSKYTVSFCFISFYLHRILLFLDKLITTNAPKTSINAFYITNNRISFFKIVNREKILYLRTMATPYCYLYHRDIDARISYDRFSR